MSFGDDTLYPSSSADRLFDLLEDEYPRFVEQRRKLLGSKVLDVLHMAVGASGEAGENLDAAKKSWIYNKPLDEENIKEECGDMLFYIQGMCNILGIKIEDLIRGNIAKLYKRYPQGYTDKDAQARADKNGS